MNINTARTMLLRYYQKKQYFIYNGSRGFTEEFYGMIFKIFPRCFLVETIDHHIKCFSYSDFIIRSLVIY